MNQEVVPFGKYKGQPVEVLANDRGYCDWLMSQGDFMDRYSGIKTLIINKFKESDDSPEHNKLQGMFLNEDFCVAFHIACIGQEKYLERFHEFHDGVGTLEGYETEFCCESDQLYFLKFEESGVDVSFSIVTTICKGNDIKNWMYSDNLILRFQPSYKIELKPSVGDDYPSIMRQMKSNECRQLLYENYVGKGVTEENMKKMFELSGMQAISLAEVKI